jgi:hypothetical protein
VGIGQLLAGPILRKIFHTPIRHVPVDHADDLVSGYWTFDGQNTHWNTNTTEDLSGQGNTGTLVSMSTTSSPTRGKIGQALNFNGSTDYVNNTTFIWPGNSTSTTISLWVKTSGYPSTCSAFVVGPLDATDRFQAHIPWNDNQLYWDMGVPGRHHAYRPTFRRIRIF